MSIKTKTALLLAFAYCGPMVSQPIQAQVVDRFYDSRYQRSPAYRYWYAPVDVAAAQVFAYSDLLRSAAARNRAEAAVLRAEANSKEIRNSIDRVRSYWKRKEVHRAAMLQRYISQIDRVKYANSERWKRMASLPELSAPDAIHSGSALNFLLNRLDGTVLTYDFQFRSRQEDDELRSKLSLDPNVVSGLQFRQLRKGGQYFEFNAELGEALDLSWWPFGLRHTDYFNRSLSCGSGGIGSRCRAGCRESFMSAERAWPAVTSIAPL